MSSGTSIRLGQLRHAPSGTILGVAFDHGGSGIPSGGADVEGVCRRLAASNADALLLGPGVASREGDLLAAAGAPRLIVSVDAPVFSALPGKGSHTLEAHCRLIRIEHAASLGATAVKVLLPIGRSSAAELRESMQIVAGVVDEAHVLGIPVMVEPALWGPLATQDDELILHSNRVAVELGADLLKTSAPASEEALGDLVRYAPVPVVILGGAARSRKELLGDVARWMAAGAAGVVVGRNVWMSRDPVHVVDALAKVVHGDDLEGALHVLAKENDGDDGL